MSTQPNNSFDQFKNTVNSLANIAGIDDQQPEKPSWGMAHPVWGALADTAIGGLSGYLAGRDDPYGANVGDVLAGMAAGSIQGYTAKQKAKNERIKQAKADSLKKSELLIKLFPQANIVGSDIDASNAMQNIVKQSTPQGQNLIKDVGPVGEKARELYNNAFRNISVQDQNMPEVFKQDFSQGYGFNQKLPTQQGQSLPSQPKGMGATLGGGISVNDNNLPAYNYYVQGYKDPMLNAADYLNFVGKRQGAVESGVKESESKRKNITTSAETNRKNIATEKRLAQKTQSDIGRTGVLNTATQKATALAEAKYRNPPVKGGKGGKVTEDKQYINKLKTSWTAAVKGYKNGHLTKEQLSQIKMNMLNKNIDKLNPDIFKTPK